MKTLPFFVPAALALCQWTAHADTLTINIDQVKNDGTITIQWQVNGGGIKEKDISVGAGDQSSLASAIASAIGSSASAVGSKVSIKSDGNSGYATIISGGLVKYTNNSDGFSYAPGTPAGVFDFVADGGNNILMANGTVTAGFTAGLPDVMFSATAGETTTQLTGDLESALFTAGYKTALLPSGGLEIFADGVSSSVPTEFDLTLDTNGLDPGISTSVASSPTPEPGTLALFGVALVGAGLVRRKRWYAVQHI